MKLHLAGKIIVSIQILLSAVLLLLLKTSGFVPETYFWILLIILSVMAVFNMFLQFRKSRIFILGIVLSIPIIAFSVLAIAGVLYAVRFMDRIAGIDYQTYDMVVVVKAEDKAEQLQDIANYRFGIQTGSDTENTEKMIQDIETNLGRDVKIQEYDNIQQEAQALLSGRVEAAVYNNAFSGILEEYIDGYADQVKEIYRYGVEVPVEADSQEPEDAQESFNLYISGIDVDGPISTTSRSDVNIIASVNPQEHKILLTSTPRDYFVTIPGISGEQRDKLTHAGIYGVDKSMETLENLYGIDITYYVKVNFTSVVAIVDALGGVDVDSPYEFSTSEYHFNQGVNHLDGDMALAFARERYSFTSGDNQRGRNQEILLTALIQKALSPAILQSMGSLIDTLSSSVETNMSREQMTALISRQLAEGSQWTIESTAAIGAGDTQACYSSGSQPLYVMWPNEDSVENIKAKIEDIMH